MTCCLFTSCFLVILYFEHRASLNMTSSVFLETVDFGVDPPIWSGEANGPQPIMPGADPQSPSFSPSLSKKKSSVFLPNPQSGKGLLPPQDQDVVILQYIDEYERKKRREGRLAKGPGADDSESSDYSTESNMEFEDTDHFEASEESEDPLYRQVSQMTAEQKADLGVYRQSQPQSQYQKMTGYSNGGVPGAAPPQNSLVSIL